MSLPTISLIQEEIDFIISKYQQELEVLEPQLNALLEKKGFLLKRIAELKDKEVGVEYKSTVTHISPILITKKSRQQDIFTGKDNLQHYNTLRKRMEYVFELTNGELSTGEMHAKLLEIFPELKNKNQQILIQTISKELGSNAKNKVLYYKNDNKRDKNGKARFGLLK